MGRSAFLFRLSGCLSAAVAALATVGLRYTWLRLECFFVALGFDTGISARRYRQRLREAWRCGSNQAQARSSRPDFTAHWRTATFRRTLTPLRRGLDHQGDATVAGSQPVFPYPASGRCCGGSCEHRVGADPSEVAVGQPSSSVAADSALWERSVNIMPRSTGFPPPATSTSSYPLGSCHPGQYRPDSSCAVSCRT
jgi:hypothetical protein